MKENSLSYNIKFFTIGSYLSKFIMFLILPYLTYTYSVKEYGTIDLLLVTLNLLTPIVSLAIVESIVRYGLSFKDNTIHKVITNGYVYIFCLLPLLIISIIIGIIYEKYLFIIFIFILYFQIIREINKQATRVTNNIIVFMISDLVYSLVFVSFIFLLNYFLGSSIENYFIALLMASLFDNLYLIIKAKIYHYILINQFDLFYLKKMLIYSIPLIPNSIIWWLIISSDRYIVNFYLGLTAVGIYTVANKFNSLLFQINTIFTRAWQMVVYEKFEKKEYKYINEVFNNLISFLVITVCLLIITSNLLMKYFIDEKFYSAIDYIPLILFSTIFMSTTSFLETIYQARYDSRGILISTLSGGLINLLLNFMLVPIIGIFGAVISTNIAFIYNTYQRMIYCNRIFYIKFNNISKISLVFLVLICFNATLHLSYYGIINIIFVSIIILINFNIFLKILKVSLKSKKNI